MTRIMALALSAALGAGAEKREEKGLAADILRSAGVSGGLCALLGCGDGALAAELAATGRFIVHAIDPDAAAVASAQKLLHARGLYGLAWAEQRGCDPLPYTENLVNLIVVAGAKLQVSEEEITRVLAPNGAAIWPSAGPGEPRLLRKPWPEGMDEWPMPRRGPDGNAASSDTLAGPPRRIRWVTGPWHEASNMVTAGGRFYHAGLIARDAFNGLRLWSQRLDPAPFRFGYSSGGPAGSVLPVLARDRVFAVTAKQVVALDPATGATLREYPEAGHPSELIYDRGVLLAAGKTWLRALDATGGKLLWSAEGAEIDGLVSGDDGVFFLDGDLKRGQRRAIVCLDRATGRDRWRREAFPWLPRARRLSCGNGLLIAEVSTLKDDRPGNSIHVLSARDGAPLWEREWEPGMTHYLQARAIQAAGLVWVLLKDKWEGHDPRDGRVVKTARGAGGHCFPPVATPRFLLSSEMSFADIATGMLDSNRITKGNCSREMGFMPANGLVYVGPKHCACWPMLRGYAALAPAASRERRAASGEPEDAPLQRGPAYPALPTPHSALQTAEWPIYRADIWRSASTPTPVPAELEVLWTARLGGWPQGPMTQDWRDNVHSRGPITPPVIAGGLAVVARPEAHQVVAFDAATGERRWDFTANGRVDTAPTLHSGLVLFGTRSGWVYCLRAADGALVWRLRAAPHEERIVAFGQLESPWPVPGSVLVLDGVAYFAAGRQPLADGGIHVFAAEPATGKILWTKRLDSVPMTGFYNAQGLEFDPFDLLVAERERPPAADAPFVTLSRWRFAPKTGGMNVVPRSGFYYAPTDSAGVMAPRGVWSYGPRMSYSFNPQQIHDIPRPLAAFRGGTLLASSEDGRELFRTDFTPDTLAGFNDAWFSHGHVARKKEEKRDRNRHERLARTARWTIEVQPPGPGIAALVIAADTAFAADRAGRLRAIAVADGKTIAERALPPPVWDGLAAAGGKLFLATQAGDLLCLGKR